MGWNWPTAAARPGSITAFVLATSDICTEGRWFRDLRVVLPGGSISFLTRYEITCVRDNHARVLLSAFGVPSLAKAALAAVSPLRISAHLPSRVGASSMLHYTVTITNSGRRPFRLQPCPSYEEGIVDPRASRATRNYYLNCNALHAIAPHRSVTYAMVIGVPDSEGVAKFFWQLHVEGTPEAVDALRIARRT